MKIGVILNPKSGSAESISELLTRLPGGQAYRLFPLRQPGDEAKAIADAVEAGLERVVVAGGDGTIHQVVAALAPEFPELELALLPLGTGNDLARSFGVGRDVGVAVDVALGGEATAIDVVEVRAEDRQSWFINVANGGFGGRVASEVSSDDKERWGPLAYWMSSLAAIAKPTAYDVELTVDDQVHQLKVSGLAVANGRFVGGGFPVSPTARLDDGQLDVVCVEALPALDLMAVGVDVALGRETREEAVRRFRGRRVRVRSQPEMPFSIDGELEHRDDATFELIPAALRMVPGPEAPAIGRAGESPADWAWEFDPEELDRRLADERAAAEERWREDSPAGSHA